MTTEQIYEEFSWRSPCPWFIVASYGQDGEIATENLDQAIEIYWKNPQSVSLCAGYESKNGFSRELMFYKYKFGYMHSFHFSEIYCCIDELIGQIKENEKEAWGLINLFLPFIQAQFIRYYKNHQELLVGESAMLLRHLNFTLDTATFGQGTEDCLNELYSLSDLFYRNVHAVLSKVTGRTIIKNPFPIRVRPCRRKKLTGTILYENSFN